jgi:hypothetical protein
MKELYKGRHRSYEADVLSNRKELFERLGLRETMVWLPIDFSRLDYSETAGSRSWDHDHPEVYRTADNKILVVFSNYGRLPHPALGMELTKPLYYAGAESFIRLFDSAKHMRQVFKAALGARR